MAEKKGEDLMIEARNFFNFYKKEIGKSVRAGKHIIYVDFDDISSFSHTLAEQLISSPEEIFQVLEVALEESGLVSSPRVRLSNIPEMQFIKVRNIRAKHLNQLISVEGIIRQASDVRPQVVNAKFECPSCGTIISVLQMEKRFREPSRCSCGRKGQFNLVTKEMVDAQRIVIEESPESLIGGEQPRRMSVFLKEDLVEPKMEEKTTPGARVKIIGILKEVPVPLQTGAISTRFDLAIEANNIIPLEETFEEFEISEEDERQIQELAADKAVLQKMTESIAPSIYGYEEIKQALVLQLFGGVKKKRADGTDSRGDMHILLVGDPGCLVGDERVALGNGAIVKISNLGKEHLDKIKTQILTGEGGKKRDYAEVFHYYKQQPIIEIITETGKSIKGTYNHPLLNIGNENGKLIRKWKRLDEFKIGDKVAVATSIPCTITSYLQTNFKPLNRKLGPKFKYKLPQKLNPELASLLGYMLGDGWVLKYRIGFVIAEPEIDIATKLLKMYESLFGIKPEPRKRKLLPRRKVQMYYYSINSIDITNSLQFMQEKRVPEMVLKSGNKVVSSFLRWLYEADGTVFDKGRGKRAISLKSKNIEMLKDVQILLLRFSIHSRIIGDSLMIRRGKEIIKFAKKIGFVSKKKRNILKRLVSNAKSFARFNAQRSERVTKIIYHNKPEDVFDIEIPNSHRFIANGIISHNTAKSIILKFMSMLAPKGRYVVGGATTGAGITATVVRDEFLRGWALEAGAMVLSNKGMICIDEIDKMNPEDRSAMHEALEQQSVTISKANVQASLRAETSVLAAANPKLGRFEPFQVIAQQINMPPTLLNRFDVIFIMRDLPDRGRDEAIATHVLLEHKREGKGQVIDKELFRKYIAYAKQKVAPMLTDAAVDEIKKFYVELRNAPVSAEGIIKPIPISARQLEAMVRLSEATAKARLSKKVTKEDAKLAIEIMKYYLMQVGFDQETKTFDIDRIATGVSTSQRGRIILVREALSRLENRMGKLIPIEEIQKELEEKMDKEGIEESIQKLKQTGDIFEPRKGYVQRV